jgi:hypothetical protein
VRSSPSETFYRKGNTVESSFTGSYRRERQVIEPAWMLGKDCGRSDVLHCTDIWLREYLCGCDTWSLMLREERRLKVFENRA